MPFPVSRRDWLSVCGTGLGSLALADLVARDASAEGVDGFLGDVRLHHAPRAKRVIHLFMNGGPSHVDTFDPKPELGRLNGQTASRPNLKTERPTGAVMASPFRFDRYGESGLEVSELFARTAAFADDLCVVRGMHADVPNHEPSMMLMNTGEARLVRPSMGSWLSYGLGTGNENLPSFVVLCPGGYPTKEAQNWQNAFLPGEHQATYVDAGDRHTGGGIGPLIDNLHPGHLSDADQRRQFDLLADLNRSHAADRDDGRLESRIRSFELAYRMQAEASEAFDVTLESDETRDAYGRDGFGRSVLLARRLAERGVRFVQVYTGKGQPWDNHDDLEVNHRRLADMVDRAVAALLADLKRSGLLDETLVLWGGEFGRTPVVELPKEDVNQGKMNGRDHNHHGFTVWMAGGGVRGGHVHGATDELGFAAVEGRTHVHDLHATMLHLLGYDHRRLTYRHAGRDFRLTDVHGRVVEGVLS